MKHESKPKLILGIRISSYQLFQFHVSLRFYVPRRFDKSATKGYHLQHLHHHMNKNLKLKRISIKQSQNDNISWISCSSSSNNLSSDLKHKFKKPKTHISINSKEKKRHPFKENQWTKHETKDWNNRHLPASSYDCSWRSESRRVKGARRCL